MTIKPNNSCSRSTAPALSPQQQCAKYVSVVRGKGEGWHQHRPFAKKASELTNCPFATIETNAFLCELCLQRICTISTLQKGKMEKIWLAPPRPHDLYAIVSSIFGIRATAKSAKVLQLSRYFWGKPEIA